MARNLLDAPLVLPDGIERLGRALWLYVRLLTLTNGRGLIIRKRDQLAHDLHVSEERIDAWLGRLADAKLVEIQAPAPFLVIKLEMSKAVSNTYVGDCSLQHLIVERKSTQFMLVEPNNFAGAQVITANTFRTNPRKASARWRELTSLAVKLARESSAVARKQRP